VGWLLRAGVAGEISQTDCGAGVELRLEAGRRHRWRWWRLLFHPVACVAEAPFRTLATPQTTRALASAAACFVVGFPAQGIRPDSDTAHALSLALLLGMLLFIIVAPVDLLRQRH
jgi:hypothetical protein